MSAEPVFALDIGTRKVAGVVAEANGRSLRLLAASVIEHPDRSMQDGQVHKVDAVAAVVERVKAELEAQLGRSLHAAAVAAAGRALLTESAVRSRHFPFATEIIPDEVLALELSATRAAQTALRGRIRTSDLHCVGYSPTRLTLDDEVLDDLVGHQGREISAEVLATFLPRQVVASLRPARLTAVSLTLEPIAAIEATIPPDLRRMNLALVDIGAGTSDIALTRGGSVFAYAMVTQAGDEITERLCELFLMEFHEGERVKRLLGAPGEGDIAFTTLLGQERELPKAEMVAALRPDVEHLARTLAERILALNGGAPKAVVMVGGGSATCGLGERVAAELGIDAGRVGIRGPWTIPDLENPTGRLNDIGGVTPLGIALTALRGRGMTFTTVAVNEHPVQLLALSEQPTLFDAVLASGREIKRLHPRPGRAVTYTLGGRLQTLPGGRGREAVMRQNDEPAHLDTPVSAGDRIFIEEAVDGEDAVLTPERVPPFPGPAWCVINGRHQDLKLVLALQGEPVASGQALPDRADLDWVSDRNLAELVPEIALRKAAEAGYTVRVNGQAQRLDTDVFSLTANGRPVSPAYRPRPDDTIESKLHAGEVRVRDLVGDLARGESMTVVINGRNRRIDYGGSRVLVNGATASGDDPVPDRAEVVVESLQAAPPILSQVLEGVPLTPPEQGGTLRLTVDGEEAGFTTPLHDGARVEVTFV